MSQALSESESCSMFEMRFSVMKISTKFQPNVKKFE